MSFDQQSNFGQQPGFGQQPQQPPKKSNKTLFIILGVVGGLGVLGCACCGIGGYSMFNLGMSAIGDAVADELRQNDRFIEEMGQLQSSEINFMRSTEYQGANPGSANTYVVEVTATGGAGDVIAQVDQRGADFSFRQLKLQKSTGEEINLLE